MRKIFTILTVSLFSVLSAMAQLPYNTTMTNDHYNEATIVKSDGDNGWDGGVRLGNKDLDGFDYKDKYVVLALSENGIPKKITCNTEAKSISSMTPPTDIVFYIAWSADNSNFTTLETKKSKTNSFDVELPKETKYIKLCYSGNFGGYFTDIVVEELEYCNAPEHDVWEPIGTIGEEAMLGEITMVWGSTEPFELTLTGEGASQFTVAIDNNASKGKEGVALISATYKLDVAGVHEAVMTVDNGTYSYEIALKGTTLKKEQKIVWNDDLSTVNALDTVVLTASANTAVSYAVSDESVASIEGDKLIAHRAGKVVVYAYAAESDVYNADTLSMDAVVVTIDQDIVWEQDLTNLHVFDTVVLNATAKTELTYSVSDDAVASIEGDKLIAHRAGKVVVYAYAAESDVYNADTLSMDAVVVTIDQDIVWEQDLTNLHVFDTVVLNATAKTELTYSVSDDAVASIEGNQLVLHAVGEVLVYAYAVENDVYNADTLVKTIVVNRLEQDIEWTLDTLVMTVGDTLVLNAVATSGLEVSYLTDVDSVVLIEAGVMVALTPGEVVLTALQEGDDNYLAAERIEYTITVIAAEDDEDGDVTTDCENVTSSSVKAHKVVKDGRIYIVRGNQMYDMLGNL